MMTSQEFLLICSQAAIVMLLIAMALVLWRLARGPTAADRVIALDLLSVLVVAFLVSISIYAGETSYLDVAIAYACIAFLGTVALARFILRASQSRSSGRKGEDIDD